jgi:hypothetical protein
MTQPYVKISIDMRIVLRDSSEFPGRGTVQSLFYLKTRNLEQEN